MNTAVRNLDGSPENRVTKLDAAIVGAGVAGLYQLYQLRSMGLNVRAYDAASDVGGTWYWNRYPGARFDSEAYIYQYLFSEELYKGWSWSERFPGQPEIERWMHYVTDSLDLRKDIQLDTRIASAHFNEDTRRWSIRTEDGRDHRRPVPDHLLRHALRPDERNLPGPGQLQRPHFPHRALAT